VLLSRGRGLILAGIATLLYGGVLWAVRVGAVPPQALREALEMPAKHLFYSVFVTGVACGTVGLIGGYLSESLRTAGERLEEAAEQVADLQQLNQVIVDSIHSGLVTMDADLHVVYVNPLGAAILGTRPQDLRGRALRDVFASLLLDVPAVRARVAARSLARLEMPYQKPDGVRLTLGLSLSPLQTADASTAGYLLVFQDLTEIKRLEEEVRMKEKLAAVGEMAAALAHEIRNPLGSISGSAQVLMAEANISPEQERLLAIITRESRRLSETLNQFLFQARPNPTPPGPVDLGPVISAAVTLLRNGSEVGPSRSVTFETSGGPFLCLADPDQITQVFWNLTRNGLEAMPDGGTLRIRLVTVGDNIVLSVRDEGRGMGREQQRRLFEPFQSGTPVGTGLGLAIVYRIVREHRGDITVRSTPLQGTDVEVRLPLVMIPTAA
jgi:two-component system sensor histidine kinase PilS (NtrC family)